MTTIHPTSTARARRAGTVVSIGAMALIGCTMTATTAAASTPPEDTTEAAPTESAPSGSTAPAEIQPIAVTLTDSSIDGLPTDLVAGLVEVSVTGEPGTEVSFSRVEPGTDPAAFVEELGAVIEGAPFPDFFLNTAGAVDGTITALDEGEYIVWVEGEEIITAPMTVGPGDNDAVVPAQDSGSIRAGDYLFDADAVAGGSMARFTNSSDNQFHHVVLVDFGSNDPAVVEENLPALLASEDEDAPLPEGIDPSQVNFEFAFSPVYGPGSSGTFPVTFEDGHTYAALCFISDREGGLPHAIQHGMFDVFQVGAAA
jgi:hypothetical protein